MDITDIYKFFENNPSITIDSRTSSAGSIFFALKGPNFDGNEFALQALENGCSYAIIDNPIFKTHPNMILVNDALSTLQEMAHLHRKKFKIPVIAITGTNGKTTTKELVTSVLSQEYNVLSTKGNFNNHIGVPLTLLSMKKEHEIAVIEMGANHLGEIKKLAEIAVPDYGLITNIGHAHIEGFGSYENIIKAKSELYDYLRNHDGKVFVNYDNELLRELTDKMTTIYYGLGESRDQFLTGKVISSNPFLQFEWNFVSCHHVVKTQLIGKYNLSNALAAIAIGKYFGIKGKLICKALEEYIPNNNRSQLKKTDHNMLIIDAYNANPTSMLAALDNFDQMQVNHKVLILGDMNELGEESTTEHQNIINYISQHNFDMVFLIGKNFKKINNKYLCFTHIDQFIEYLAENPIKGSYILLKGSRKMCLEKCIDML